MAAIPSHELPRWLLLLPAAVVLTSWFDWAPRRLGLVGRAGPYWAALVLAFGLLIAIWRGHVRPLRVLADDWVLRRIAMAGAMVVVCWGVAAIGAVDRTAALFETTRVLGWLVFLVAAFEVTARDERVGQALAWVAFGLIAAQSLVLVAGLASGHVGTVVFEKLGQHSCAGSLPRFRGLMPHASACGGAMLLLVGLVAGLRCRALRIAGAIAGLAVTTATLSFATLVLPVAVVLALPVRRMARAVGGSFFAAAALAALWTNPLRVEILGRKVLERTPVTSYYRDGLGPRHMPIHVLCAPGMQIGFHFSGYALLAARSVSCVREHPLGIGARNFAGECPVMAMGTFGGWGLRHSPHNAYGALLTEGGLLTTLATCAFVMALALGFRPRQGTSLLGGIVAAYLLAGFGGASPYQFPFAALLAVGMERRVPHVRVGEQRRRQDKPHSGAA